jgi:hypothetical protein
LTWIPISCIFRNSDGRLTIDDLRGVYIATKHPKYLNGQWSEDQVLQHFLDCFDMGHHKDGIVSIMLPLLDDFETLSVQ